MKVKSVEAVAVEGLAAPWMFCIIRTDDGITGYSEFGEGLVANGMAGLVKDLSRFIVGQDPRQVEKLYMDMFRGTQSVYGGATWQAMAGIELALWDVKAKALGVPVYELFGGPTRTEQRVYWSHLATYQAGSAEKLGAKPIKSLDDACKLVEEARAAGYDCFKTNILIPAPKGQPWTGIRQGRSGPHDQPLTRELLNTAVRQIKAFREAAGTEMDICLDVNVNFKAAGQIRLGQALAEHDLYWMEIDNLDAKSLRMVKEQAGVPICSGEQKLGPISYLPYFEERAMDVVKVDVQWQGFTPARNAAKMAEVFDMNIAPHNFNGHLSTFQTMNLCASINNVLVSESDPAQVKWRDELVTHVPEIKNGHVTIPTRPGWGTDLDEKALKKYAVAL
ncbi:MAG: mandelate racemase/muconate lactonizing enzyme family protein [Chloroflexi bacterium]|nr:mandelate racemase/muconate lactonizing enzyme family protein [Chloroflexota bacterium]